MEVASAMEMVVDEKDLRAAGAEVFTDDAGNCVFAVGLQGFHPQLLPTSAVLSLSLSLFWSGKGISLINCWISFCGDFLLYGWMSNSRQIPGTGSSFRSWSRSMHCVMIEWNSRVISQLLLRDWHLAAMLLSKLNITCLMSALWKGLKSISLWWAFKHLPWASIIPLVQASSRHSTCKKTRKCWADRIGFQSAAVQKSVAYVRLFVTSWHFHYSFDVQCLYRKNASLWPIFFCSLLFKTLLSST